MLLKAAQHYTNTLIDLGIAKDIHADTKNALDKGFQSADVIISTGGVSMGEVDWVKKCLIDNGSTVHFGRVAMKPTQAMEDGINAGLHSFLLSKTNMTVGRKYAVDPYVEHKERIDAIMASMSITEDRLQTIDFSDPYYNTPTVIVGQRGMEMDATPEGLAGMVLGVQVSTIHQTYAQTYFEGETEIRTYQTQDEANQDLAAGRIDATQADSLAMDDFLNSEAGACCELKGAVAHDESILGSGVGVGVRKGDDALREQFNAGIAAIIENGTYDEITARYFATSIYGQ